MKCSRSQFVGSIRAKHQE